MDALVFQLVDLVEKIRSHHSSRSGAATAASTSTSSTASTAAGTSSQSKPTDTDTTQQEIIKNSPAVKFLTRTDFFSLVQYSDVSIYSN